MEHPDAIDVNHSDEPLQVRVTGRDDATKTQSGDGAKFGPNILDTSTSYLET